MAAAKTSGRNADRGTIFQNPVTRTLLALLTVAMWALPFSLIKVGMVEFGVASGDVPGEALFAGVRFLAAGLCVLAGCAVGRRDFHVSGGAKGLGVVLLFGLVNIGLHYLLFYMGVGVSAGGRSSVIYSCSTFFLIIASCLVFADDKMSPRKALGCVVGLSGICLVNLDLGNPGQLLAGVSLQTDGVLVLAAVSAACGGLLTRFATAHADAFVCTGYSLVIGGGALCLVGLALGGSFAAVTPAGLAVLAVLIFVSAAAFAIYNKLLTCNPVSSVAIFNSCIPVLGLIFSCFILSEPFRPEYALAACLSAAGIILVNTAKTPKGK